MIADPPRACFIHVFKAGGTFVSDWLCSHYPVSAVPPNPESYAADPGSYDAPLLRGHIYARDVVGTGRILLTVLRKPEAQLMSALWHMITLTTEREHPRFSDANRDALVGKARELRQFYELTQSRFFAPMHDLESAPHMLARIGIVGLTERMADSLRLFAWRLRLPSAPVISDAARFSGAGNSTMRAEVCDLMSGHLEFDQPLYAEAERRFASDFDHLVEEVGSDEGAQIDRYLTERASVPA